MARTDARSLARITAVGFVAGLAGGVLGVWLAGGLGSKPRPDVTSPSVSAERLEAEADSDAPDPALVRAELIALRRDLQRERIQRERIEQNLALLVEELSIEGLTAPDEEDPGEAASSEGGTPLSAASTDPKAEDLALAFDAAALVAAGIEARRADELRARWEAHEMEKLYLSDQAAREGWAMTGRHRKELRAIKDEFRSELADEDYDAYLYASDATNRAVVRDVLDASPASQAGFRPGDTILSYDGARIFSPGELKRATFEGRAGDQVRVEYMRDGERQSVIVARGPMGLLLKPQTLPPIGD